jgi:TetR/AcrR family transcriptional repressor of nem operon
VRKSRQEAAQTRQRIVESASVEFRRRGIAGTGLADLMAAAGMTHGGFYKHFESKEQVVEESVALATETMLASMQASLSAAPGSRGLRTVMADYLSTAYRDDSSEGCPFVTLGSEMARSSEAVREAAAGFLQIVDMLAGQFEDLSPAAARKEAMLMFSTMIGAMTMARVVTDPRLSATLLQQVRKHLAP